jgi:hypothetical protein
MIDWRRSMERTFDLLLVIGLALIVFGFVESRGYSPGEIIVSGTIIVLIGAYGILKRIKKEKKKK